MKHISDTPPSIRTFGRYLPKRVEDVVFKALQKQPSNRYQSAQMLARDLRKAFEKTMPEAIIEEDASSLQVEWEAAHTQEGDTQQNNENESLSETEAIEGKIDIPSAANVDTIISSSKEMNAENAKSSPKEKKFRPIPFGPSNQQFPRSLNINDTQEIPRRTKKQKPLNWTSLLITLSILIVGILFLLFVLPQFFSQVQNSISAVAGQPKYNVGQQVLVNIPGGASTSLYDGCRSFFGGKLVGMASDGQKAQIKGRVTCGDKWYYQIFVNEAVTKEWDGVGFISGNYIK